MSFVRVVGFVVLVVICVNLLSFGIALARLRLRSAHRDPLIDARSVSIIRPVCGLDNFSAETLSSTYRLDYPSYEVIFCVAKGDDVALPLLRRLVAENPQTPSRLLVGEDCETINPKLNNCLKGWAAAKYQWIVLADSNVLMPVDYLQRLQAPWDENTGVVCSPPIGSQPTSFWAEVECAFLNTFQCRWQFVLEALGLGFVHGKTMMWNRAMLDEKGGLHALGAESSDDTTATKLIGSLGLKVRLVDMPFEQPLGRRSFNEVWSRQMRWAAARRASFPLLFASEIVNGPILPALAGAYMTLHGRLDPKTFATLASLWYLPEILLTYKLGWYLAWTSPFAMLLRDLLCLAVWVGGWFAHDFVWHGNIVSVSKMD